MKGEGSIRGEWGNKRGQWGKEEEKKKKRVEKKLKRKKKSPPELVENMLLTRVGFEPTPFRTTELSRED